MKHSSSVGAMSPRLPDMDKLKTQAESVHGTVVDTAIVSILDGDLAVWRQDTEDRSTLVIVNRTPLKLEGNEVRGVTMVVYPPEDRIDNRLTLIQETLGSIKVGVEQVLGCKEEEVVEEDVKKNTPQPVVVNSPWFDREIDKFHQHHHVHDYN